MHKHRDTYTPQIYQYTSKKYFSHNFKVKFIENTKTMTKRKVEYPTRKKEDKKKEI